MTGRRQHGGVRLLDDGRTGQARAGAEVGALEHGRVGGAAVEPDPALPRGAGAAAPAATSRSGTRGREARSWTRRFTISAGASRSA